MMNRERGLWRVVLCGVLAFWGRATLHAQKLEVPSRVKDTVDVLRTVPLTGNVHPLARPASDQGALPDSQPMTRMMLLLQRSPAQELSLRQLLDAQQTKSSGSYHAWLTPAQFGDQFGPSDSDVQAVTDWLTREGFQVKKVAAGKTVIEFDGTAGQVRNALHTEIHKFLVDGETHFANVSDPAIPEALSPVIAGVVALHNFPKHPNIRKSGLYRRTEGTSELQPLFTFGNPARYALGPGDFAKIYNIPSTATGAGQSIAIIAQTNINTQDVVDYRSMFGLPAYSSVCTSGLPPSCPFSVIVNGVDPGIISLNVVSCLSNDDEVESDLDTQWAGAVAPGANIYLVVSQSTCANPSQVSQGVDLSALFAVDNNIAPVISDSYGKCEAALLTAGNQFYNSLWEQAASQGITVAVSAGDSGSAGCDPIPSIDAFAASQGVAVNGLASTPFNVAVGGTDFDPTSTSTSASTYWAPTTSAGDTINSALGYIPETTWNDSACAFNYPAACTKVDTTNGADISAGSGGPSNCVVGTASSHGQVVTCGKNSSFPNYGYPKPTFQSALTPADNVRDIPDVSFFASNGGPLSGGAGVAYVICQSDANANGASCDLSSPYQDFSLVGGTSAATPAFAAVMALVNQATGERQGNANYVLYNLASTDANYTGSKCESSLGGMPAAGCVFNDVTKGNNAVACDAGTPNCNNTSGTAGQYGVVICSTSTSPACPAADNGQPAFQAVAKYDLATGLGSINVGNLLTKWTAATRTATTTTLTAASGGSPSGSNFTATVNVTPAAATGDVSLIALKSDQTTVLGSFGPFSLTGGTAAVSTDVLPVGTAYVAATYGGNVTYAVSTSTPVVLGSAVGGANYTAKTTLNFISFNSSGTPSNPTTSAQTFPYGSPYILQIVVSRADGTSCAFGYPNTKPTIPCPTGTITLTDNGNALNDFVNNGKPTNVTGLNNLGLAEDQPVSLSATVGSTTPGVHNLVATYSGDQNYAAGSASNTLKITIQQVVTTTQVSSSLSSITSGATVLLTAVIIPSTSSNGSAPCGPGSTGKVQFTSNGSNLSGTVTYVPTPGQNSANGASCTATLSTAISSFYPTPPIGRPGSRVIPRIPLLVAFFSLLFFALGLRWIPQTRRRAYAYVALFAIAALVGVVAGCGGGGGGGGGGGSTRTIGAAYTGDANYKSSSGTITIQVQ
jgi:subtilase family serine protease